MNEMRHYRPKHSAVCLHFTCCADYYPKCNVLYKLGLKRYYGRPIGQAIIFCSVISSFFLLLLAYSHLSHGLDVYHTSTHDVALARI